MRDRPWRLWLAAVLLAVAPTVQAQTDPAREALVASLRAFRAGDLTTARERAEATVRAQPRSGVAHALAGRMALALSDGVAAEGSFDRAEQEGFPRDRLIHLRAHARLLQGDLDGAAAGAASTDIPARYGAYAARIAGRAALIAGDRGKAGAAFARAVAIAPGDGAAWADLARFRDTTGNRAGAGQALDTALRLDGRNREALLLKGGMVRSQYGLAAALPWYEAAITLDPRDGPALIEYAATLGDLGRYGEMLAASREAAAVRGSTGQALFLQAVLAARARNYDLARSLLDRAGGSIDRLPAAMLLKGGLDYAAGAHGQAVRRLGRLVDRQPGNIPARRLLGAALLASGDAKRAVAALRPLLQRPDADSYVLLTGARAFEAVGERDTAGILIDRASRPAVARFARGWRGGDALVALGRYREAADRFARDASARFDEPSALRLVDALDRAGARAEAQRVLSLFLQQNPRNISALKLAAEWQLAARDWAAAADTLEALRQRIGNRDAMLLVQLSLAHRQLGDRPRAVMLAEAAYELAPTNPVVADMLGVLWAADPQRRDDGRALLRKAVRLAPDNAGIRAHLAAAG